MIGRVLSVVTIERIHARAAKALIAAQNGEAMTPDVAGKLLTDMLRVIESHEQQAVRLRTAQLALDGGAHIGEQQ